MTDTIALWQGQFGTDYTKRNNRVPWSDRVPLWRRIVEKAPAKSFLDVGCNAGWNMFALATFGPEPLISGCDINEEALDRAREMGLDVHNCPADGIVEKFGAEAADMVITSGVLIHIAPDALLRTMKAIRDCSRRFVVAIEYDSDTYQEVEYRGQTGALWKRPYGKLYEEIGMTLFDEGEAEGYDQCHYWVMEKA